MMRPGNEPWSPGPLANTLPTRPMWWFKINIVGQMKFKTRLPQCYGDYLSKVFREAF